MRKHSKDTYIRSIDSLIYLLANLKAISQSTHLEAVLITTWNTYIDRVMR